ncbi:MAG: hypothetical protein PHT69_01015 [Bacteroidales bacterium]|nr:hypothetical protein [Bacteroidales bacterium]
MRIFLIISLVIIYSCIYGQDNNTECLSFFKRFEEPWKADSLGQNGFRTLVYFYFLGDCRECSLNGLDWGEVEKILGVPNEDFLNCKRYWLGLEINGTLWWIALRLNIDADTNKIERTFFEHS